MPLIFMKKCGLIFAVAIVVSQLTNAETSLMSSLLIFAVLGEMLAFTKLLGILLAIIAALLLSPEPEYEARKNV